MALTVLIVSIVFLVSAYAALVLHEGIHAIVAATASGARSIRLKLNLFSPVSSGPMPMKSTVMRRVIGLVKRGYLTRTPRGRGFRYTVNWNPVVTVNTVPEPPKEPLKEELREAQTNAQNARAIREMIKLKTIEKCL